MSAWIVSLLSRVGSFILSFLLEKIWGIVSALFTRWKKKQDQEEIDKENVGQYREVKEGHLSDEEDIKRTEQLLNGRKP